jgi:hypothetical protein
MTTRAKLICAGLLALAAGVALVVAPARRPQLELSFVRYTNMAGGITCAVLGISNGRACRIGFFSPDVHLFLLSPTDSLSHGWLSAGCGAELLAWPTNNAVKLPEAISVEYSSIGIVMHLLADPTGKVVTVDLPPE